MVRKELTAFRFHLTELRGLQPSTCDAREHHVSDFLIAALPKVAQWRQASLPNALTSDEINTLLTALDQRTDGGQRDYAIARCLVDLGLRTAEIVRLKLDDIDWCQGVNSRVAA